MPPTSAQMLFIQTTQELKIHGKLILYIINQQQKSAGDRLCMTATTIS
jgi:hypothetical protein